MKLGHAGHDHGRVPARDLDVVGLAARSVTEFVEIEPRDALGAFARHDHAPVDVQIGGAALARADSSNRCSARFAVASASSDGR